MNRFYFCHYFIGEFPTEVERQRRDLLVEYNLSGGLHHNYLQTVKMDSYLRKCMKISGGSLTK